MNSLIILAQIDFATLMPFAMFGGIATAAWLIMEFLSARSTRAEQRLDEIRDPNARRRRDDDSRSSDNAMTRMLEKATPALAKPLQPKTQAESTKLRDKLAYAGFRTEAAPTIFLGTKFLGLLGGLFMGGGWAVFSSFQQNALFSAVLLCGGLFYLPDAVLWYLGRKRKEGIFLGLPDALDLLVVCVEAGLGLDQAMRKVSDEMKRSYPVISEEFALCNLQLQMGRARSEVLHELGRRTGVDDLRSLASIIIQADKFGSSIAQALRVQSDSMRVRRQQIAEEKAAKTAVKLIFPLVIFIFPGIFVVLVGPAAITMINEMFPAMSGG